MKHHHITRRTFLMLQGPHGAFFARLGAALRARGHRVCRINLNGGDRADWPEPATDFTQRMEDWPGFFDAFLVDKGVTDVVLFGDCRPFHRIAHGLAAARGITIHVFEEGYLRPDWVTLERDGVNGHSTLPRDPDFYRRAARTLPPRAAHLPVASSFARRAREAFDYSAASILQARRFGGIRTHRPHHPIVEGLAWVRQFARLKRARARSAAIWEALGSRPYFAFPLQLNSDHQILTHSPFGSMPVALGYVMESFARAAPADAVLLVKEHPLDNGLVNWRRVVAKLAQRFGLAGRVLLMESGDIAAIVAGARGVVTINSTTGTLALEQGVPVAVLGQAVYDIAGVTHQGALDDFWPDPQAPDRALWEAFCDVLVSRCLIRGGFQSDEGIAALVDVAVERLTVPTAASAPLDGLVAHG